MSYFLGQGVLVVGGGGIGAEVCRQVTAQGGHVFFTYNRNEDDAKKLEDSLPQGTFAGSARLDVTDEAATAELVEQAALSLGRLDALVTTVGFLHHLTMFEDIDMATVRKTIEIELFGVISLAKNVLPKMRANRYGRIVTIGSDSGKVGSKAEAASAAARGGVIAFTKALAREAASDDICINVVCPGPTETGLLREMLADEGLSGKLMNAMVRAIPKHRAASASEVAVMVCFLASKQASFITGQAISVSGGLTMN